jgi:hypothetical protein
MSYDKLGCSIKNVMDSVWGIAKKENNINIFKFATKVFIKISHREIFVTIKEP